MSTITLKGLPSDLHRLLKRRAEQNGRSLTKEILSCLEASVRPTKLSVDELLADIRQVRSRVKGELSDEILAETKARGRA